MRTIAAERALRGMSQGDLAEKLGVTRETVSRWETGTCKPPTERVAQMCDLFECSFDYMLGRTLDRRHTMDGIQR